MTEKRQRAALVTGENKGIGDEISKRLGHLGFQVVVSGRDENRVKEAVRKLTGDGVSASALVMDVGEVKSIYAAFKALNDSIKILDVIVNNARLDMGGRTAHCSLAKGVEIPVWLAAEAPEKLTGKFFRDEKEITL